MKTGIQDRTLVVWSIKLYEIAEIVESQWGGSCHHPVRNVGRI